jgi:hypothetical protein
MSGPAPGSPDPEGDLYDSYLDGALAGTAEDPAAFLARHVEAGPEVRARILALHRISRRGPAAPPSARREAEPGLPHERLGGFRLLRRIGAGGMGLVFEAEQESLGRLAAVKVLRPDLLISPEARERFRREAQAVARLRHPHIVSVLAAGEDGGVRWMAMDLVAGRGLDEVIAADVAAGSPPAPARAARWGARIARALEYAHARGIVHRDVKPSNIRIAPDDEPFLLDFGVAREEGGGPTLTGPFVGSVPWAAPEQLAGRPVDGRADVYALGATIYHCLTGRSPFEGGTVDRVIHRTLHEDPEPPGRVRPGVPRDLDAVVLKALEKDPARRYAGAGEMAADLEAVLDFRPVRARPPGPLRRVRAWARVHPAMAAGAVTAVAAVAVLAGTAVAREAEARRRVRLEAAEEVERARARLSSYRAQREASEGLERNVASLGELFESSWLTPAQDAEFDRKEEALAALRQKREAAFHEVLDHLRRAERLDPAVAGVEDVRARLYLEKWREAETAADAQAAGFYRALVAAHDPDGALSRAAFGRGTVTFACPAPGAEVHLFRYREEAELRPGGERRLVPVPRGTPPVPPGTFAFRVVRGAGNLRPGDLILEVAGRPVPGGAWILRGGGGTERGDRVLSVGGAPIEEIFDLETALRSPDGERAAAGKEAVLDRRGAPVTVKAEVLDAEGEAGDLRALAEGGGVPARVLSGGAVREIVLPAGLRLRPTAAPLLVGPWSLEGKVPVKDAGLEPGGWLALLRAPGFEEQRLSFYVEAGVPLQVQAGLAAEGTSPEGFVRVVPTKFAPFWMQDREATCAEYLEFLNDPAGPAQASGPAGAPRFVPRGRSSNGQHWKRGLDGLYALGDGFKADWPVLGVSFEDATYYAAWRTARDRPLAGRGAFGLPVLEEWLEAGGRDQRYWVWGNRMRPKWAKTCFARPRAYPEPGLRFPRDESVLGVLDMAGSVAEWCDDWYDAAKIHRRVAGGSWAWAKMDQCKIWGGQGWIPQVTGDDVGFRLALREVSR